MRSLKELPAALGQLKHLRLITLGNCDALQTPLPRVVRRGTEAVLQFLLDLAKGDAPCHLVKVVLLGNQHAGKSSLADSLVQRRAATRAHDDRTVGIDVWRWRARDRWWPTCTMRRGIGCTARRTGSSCRRERCSCTCSGATWRRRRRQQR
jgi:hypothetical protein